MSRSRNFRRGCAGLVPILLVALTLGFAWPAGTAAAQTELRVAVSTFTGEKVDPINGGFGMHQYQAPMYDYLVTMSRDRKPSPGIAESWSISPDGKTYTFNIRKGMKWHNGDPLTAEDVANHFDRMERGTGAFVGPFRTNIASTEVVGPYKIIFHLKNPWPDFIDFLGPGDTSVAAITPKKYTDEVGDEGFRKNPIGSGPWKLIEHKTGSYFLYEAVSGHPYRPTPGFDRLRVILVPEESTRVAMLKRGEAHLADIGFDSAKEIVASGNQVLEIPNSVLVFVSFLGAWEERAKTLNIPVRWDNKGVRKALAMAIDREELLEFMALGKGRLAPVFPAFPEGFGWNEAWATNNQTPYDPEGAKRLLAEAGYADGFKIRLYTLPISGAQWLPKMAQIVADYWKKIGVDVDLVSTEWGAFGPVAYGRPDEALGAAYTFRVTQSSFPIGRMTNYVSARGKALLANVPWDDDHAAVAQQTDMAKREKMFQDFMLRLKDTYTLIPVMYVNALFGASKDVTNWVPYNGWPSAGLSYEYFKPAG
jgi:peptide/nickel transport system substrate-binding protein